MKKEFDAVALQRKIRDELGKKYNEDPKKFVRGLKKYSGTVKRSKKTSTQAGRSV